MEQRRFTLFVALSLAILLTWQLVIVPRFFPPQKPAPAAAAKSDKPVFKPAAKPDAGKPGVAKPDAEKAAKRTKAKHTEVDLGSDDAASGFRLNAIIDSKGAVLAEASLTDRIKSNEFRYPDEHNRKLPQRIIGNDGHAQTLRLALEGFDPAFKPESMHWEVVPGSQSKTGVTYRIEWDGLELRKEFRLEPYDPHAKDEKDDKKLKTEKSAYTLKMKLTVINHLDEAIDGLSYVLDGPCGLPLENREYTAKFRDVVAKFVTEDGGRKFQMMPAGTVIAKPESWPLPLQYIGIDAQYFAALLEPVDNQLENRYTQSSTQAAIPDDRGSPPTNHSDITVLVKSKPLVLPGKGGTTTHSYDLFAGPKRDDLVDGDVLNYGWFAFISRLLLPLLHFFYSIFGSYGLAIIGLTVVVRSMLLPLSIRQARSAAKMQELQPEMAEIKIKYANDKEKLAHAQMELFSKNKVNPLGGCLPVLFQMPVFMGLYAALSQAVELRMAQFLWVDNLAAPDRLFKLPFAIPFLGEWFNLLPIITTGLFLVQQKMFMPPAMNEEQEVQQKTMTFMTVFMGFMFYKVPAGLCTYFIASSLWGLAERQLLPKSKVPAIPPAPPRKPDGGSGGGGGNNGGGGGGGGGSSKPDTNGGGWWQTILKAAEKETSVRKERAKR